MDYSRYCKKYVPYLFVAPALIMLAVFFFLPFFESFYISLLDYSKDIYNPVFVGIGNYIKLFHSPMFYKTLINTVIYLVVAVPLLVVLPLIIAVVINQKLRLINFYKVSIYLPVIVSIVVAGIAWKWLYADNGILNYLLSFFGVHKIGFLTDPKYALYSVIAVTVWKGLGYYMMIYLAALTSVPQDLYEAADIDGASLLQKHFAVTVPHLLPAIALVTIISSISAMKVFVEIFIMTQGGPLNSSMTIVYYIYQKGFENLDLGYASAVGIVLMAIIMLISVFNIKKIEGQAFNG
ncbi:MAG: sugar ABC transporter permease [Candidatus Gastranaerophilales bacterium]|nr:sugar ABC transporter permease [Candidatus Gastranaerophilales bacterium]